MDDGRYEDELNECQDEIETLYDDKEALNTRLTAARAIIGALIERAARYDDLADTTSDIVTRARRWLDTEGE